MANPFSVTVPLGELRQLDSDSLIVLTNAPYGTYSTETIAFALLLLGERPHPVCDPGHQFAPDWHTQGYTDRQGSWHGPCSSPGKAPLTRNYQRFSAQPPTVPEIYRMFNGHRGNVGGVVPLGEVRLDVDPRSGGEDSLFRYEREFGELPSTPQTLTGGGGAHFRLRLPDNCRIKAGGSLASPGYPGVEWKGPRATVVLPGSQHTSGRQYYFEVENGPDVPVADIPEPLLGLISADPARQYKSDQRRSVAGHGYTPEEVVAIFRHEYHEGERRSGTGLPRLVGLLISRGVDEEAAVDFLQDWQHLHFLPPLRDEILELQVRDMYGRYGPAETDRVDAGNKFLSWLRGKLALEEFSHVTADRDLNNQDGDQQESDSKTRRAQLRRLILIKTREQVSAFWTGGADFDTADESTKWLVPNSAHRTWPINLGDYSRAPNKDELLTFLEKAEGEDSKVVSNLANCMRILSGVCKNYPREHGERFLTKRTCKLHAHYACPTRTAYRIALIDLPDLPDGQGFRSVWFGLTYPTGTGEVTQQQNHSRTIDKVVAEVRKLAHRKGNRERLLSRALGFYVGKNLSIVQLRILFKEDAQEEAEGMIRTLCANLNAQVIADRRFQSGETAVLQLMEDASCALLGVEENGEVDLFSPWWFATRKRHLSQAMASLHGLVLAVEDVKPTCDICGGPIVFREPEEAADPAPQPAVEHPSSRSPP